MSKILPLFKEGVNWTEKPSKSAVMKQKWRDFVENSTLHGMHCIISSQTTFRRIIWTLFLLVGVGYFSYQTSVLWTKYLRYPVTTKTTLVFEREPEFPAVTICNFNMLRKSLIEKHNFTEVIDQALMSKTGVKMNETSIDWSRYKNVDVFEVYLKGGHGIQDMILDCSWKGERCGYQNFTPILTTMGLCHTFNSGTIKIATHLFSVNAFQESRAVAFVSMFRTLSSVLNKLNRSLSSLFKHETEMNGDREDYNIPERTQMQEFSNCLQIC